MSQHRLEQVASTLQRALAGALARGLSDPRVRGMVSVTRVEVSPDLRHASVFVTVMPQEHEKLTLEGLKAAAIHLHTVIKPQLQMRIVPHLHFKTDTQLKKEMSVLQAIGEARARDEKDGVAKPLDLPPEDGDPDGHDE